MRGSLLWHDFDQNKENEKNTFFLFYISKTVNFKKIKVRIKVKLCLF